MYGVGDRGQKTSLLGSAQTNASGRFSLELSSPAGHPLLAVTSGGTYVDEISGKQVPASPGQLLETLATPGSRSAVLTPLTTFATSRALQAASTGEPLGLSIAVSYSAIARMFDRQTISAVVPAVVTSRQSLAQSNWRGRQQGIELASLDQEANHLGVSDLALVDAMAQDISDGNFDGKKGSTPIEIGDPTPLPSDPIDLFTGFLCGYSSISPYLLPYLPACPGGEVPDPFPIKIDGPSTLEFLAGAHVTVYDGIPNQHGSLEDDIAGGTGPYTCSGAFPLPEFSWRPLCTIVYDGTALLSDGEAELSSYPFTFTVTDSAGHKVQVQDMTVGVIALPPTIKALHYSLECMVGVPCDIPVASASGGVRSDGKDSYDFTGDVNPPLMAPTLMRADTPPRLSGGYNAIPQLGLDIETEGNEAYLAGTPKHAGTHTIQELCVTDSSGSVACLNHAVTVEVLPAATAIAPSPTMTAPTIGTRKYDLKIQISWTGTDSANDQDSLSGSGSGTVIVQSVKGVGEASGSASIQWSDTLSWDSPCSGPTSDSGVERDTLVGVLSSTNKDQVDVSIGPSTAALAAPPEVPESCPYSGTSSVAVPTPFGLFPNGGALSLNLDDSQPQSFTASDTSYSANHGTITITVTPAR
ncbi:MAG: hypothetical protein ACREOD_06175 [Candidatus Dormibacteria bacterium]